MPDLAQPISLKRQGHLSSVLMFAGLGAYTVSAVSAVSGCGCAV